MRQWRRRQDLPRGEMAQGMLAVRISRADGSAYIATTTVSFTLAALHNLVVEGKRLHEVHGEGVLVAGHIILLAPPSLR